MMWKVIAAISIIIAVALAIWGAWTFAQVSGLIWTKGPTVWIWGSAFLAPGYTFWLIIGGILWILGTIFFILEVILHRTITRGFKIVDNGVRWDSTDIAIAAACAAIYGGALAATGGLVIIPGFTWIRPANMLSPVFGILFGIPGCLGLAIGNFIADLLAGYLSFGSIGGFIGNFLLGYIPYKFMKDHTMRSARSWAEFYIWGVIVGSVWCAIYISWWLHVFEPLIGLPPIMIWGWFCPFVIINNSLVTAIAGGLLAYILYPIVKKRGLYWEDRLMK